MRWVLLLCSWRILQPQSTGWTERESKRKKERNLKETIGRKIIAIHGEEYNEERAHARERERNGG